MKSKQISGVVNSRKVFALPYVAWIAVFTVAPLILILLYAFCLLYTSPSPRD